MIVQNSLYLSGPMSGVEAHNYPAFNAATAKLRAKGFQVCNPAELDAGDTSRPWHEYMRRDLAELVACERVAVLPGWEQSNGARLEVLVAVALGMDVVDADTLAPVVVSSRVLAEMVHEWADARVRALQDAA